MPPQIAFWVSAVLLCGAFALDMVTPQALIAAILLAVPVAIASVNLERRSAALIVLLALAADATAGWYDGLISGNRWQTYAVLNRVLVGFSIVLVGLLGAAARTAAERTGTLAAQQHEAQRADALRKAFERIRSSLNEDLVSRAIVREAVETLGADEAMLVRITDAAFLDTMYAFDRSTAEVVVVRASSATGFAQFVKRAIERREIVSLAPADPVARLCLDSLGAQHAYLAPLFDAHQALAVLVLAARSAGALAGDVEAFVRSFAERSVVALAQAKLFVELGAKNEQLAAAGRAVRERGEIIRDIVYALSHDLRTPLAAAGMTLQQALDGKYGAMPEAYLEIVRHSIEANAELRRLAETLLLVAKYESGEQSSTRAPVYLGRLARSVVAELEPMWHSKGLQVRIGDDETALALGDDAELRRAIMNLVANAVAWTPENGHVGVGISRNGSTVLVSVTDDGYGVPEADRPSLFARLPSRSLGRSGSGSGLGLYIVRRIAESHGGNAAYSPRQSGGSEFSVTLPAVGWKLSDG